jgi:hypothetical protein
LHRILKAELNHSAAARSLPTFHCCTVQEYPSEEERVCTILLDERPGSFLFLGAASR